MFFSTVAIASVAALAAASPVKRGFGGRATFYSTGLGACGENNVDSDYIVALNSAQYGSGYPGPECFKQIQISANGKTATATIMDECPTCNYGDLDMSPSLFNVFATPDDGVFQMTWDYVNGNEATPTAESSSAAAESTSASVEATSAAAEATSAVAQTETAEPTASSTEAAASSASATSNGRGGRKNRWNNNAVAENSTETATTTDSALAAPTVTATGDITEIAAAVAEAGQVVIVGATSANGTASNGTTIANATILFQ